MTTADIEAVSDPASRAASTRQCHALETGELRVKRNGEGYGRRAEQEMHELGTIEIEAIRRSGDPQQCHQCRNGKQYRVGQWMVVVTLADHHRALIGQQREGKAEQGRCGKVNPDFTDARVHGNCSLFMCAGSWRVSARITSAVTAIASKVLAISATTMGRHSSPMR
jgi:hypothetical protein